MMKRQIVYLAISTLLIMAATMVGCTEKSDLQENVTIKLAAVPLPHHLSYFVAEDKKMFGESLNIQPEFQWKGGGEMIKAMLAGDIDIAMLGVGPAAIAIDKGAEIAIIMPIQTGGLAIVSSPDIGTLEDLKGKKIATLPKGSIQDVAYHKILRYYGISEDEIEQITTIPYTEVPKALMNHQIDAALTAGPVFNLVVTGDAKILLDTTEVWPNHPSNVIVVRKDFAEKHPDAVKAFVKGIKDAQKYIKDYPEESIQILINKQKEMGFPANPDATKLEFNLMDYYTGKKGERGEFVQGVMEYVEELKKMGFLNNDLTEEDLFDWSFLDAVE